MYAHTPLTAEPLNENTWHLFEDLLATKGGCEVCWCMINYRYKKRSFEAGIKRVSLQALVAQGEPVGVLLLLDQKAVGWVSVAPRTAFPRLGKSRVLRSGLSGKGWSITCLFVRQAFLGQHLGKVLVQEACRYAFLHGAEWVEGFPTRPGGKTLPPPFLWKGLPSMFLSNGFELLTPESQHQWVVVKKALS
jgi:hypothetical protein